MRRFSILQENMNYCYVCGRQKDHIHEVFFGTANRKKSIEWGCCVGLCLEHHLGNTGVHYNRALDIQLKKAMQERFEELYNHDTFMEVFNKNYL